MQAPRTSLPTGRRAKQPPGVYKKHKSQRQVCPTYLASVMPSALLLLERMDSACSVTLVYMTVQPTAEPCVFKIQLQPVMSHLGCNLHVQKCATPRCSACFQHSFLLFPTCFCMRSTARNPLVLLDNHLSIQLLSQSESSLTWACGCPTDPRSCFSSMAGQMLATPGDDYSF